MQWLAEHWEWIAFTCASGFILMALGYHVGVNTGIGIGKALMVSWQIDREEAKERNKSILFPKG